MFFKTFFVVIVLSFFFLIFIDLSIAPLLSNYVDLEADKIMTFVVNRAVQDLNYDASSFVVVKRNRDDGIERISYNTGEINNFKANFTHIIEKKIKEIENGLYYDEFFVSQKNERSKFPHIKRGYLCEVNYNSLRNSVLFGNVGPSIPIKLSFLGYLGVDIDVKLREYGINNMLVEVDAVVDISTVVTMPVSSKKHHSIVREPISIEIISGKIPDYYLNHSS